MCIFKEYQDRGYKIIFVTPKTDKRNKEYIEQVAGICIDKVFSYSEHYTRCMFNPTPIYNTWGEYLEKENLFESLDDIEEIVVFGGILSSATALTREKNAFNKIYLSRSQMNFKANGTYLTGLFQLIKISRERKIPIHEICYDPCENSIFQLTKYLPHKLYCYHGYDWPDYNLIRLDSLQTYLKKNKSFFDSLLEESVCEEKNIDLCFGFTALTVHREKQYDDLMAGFKRVENITVKLFVRHKKLDIDAFVKRDEYISNIKRSRYTLIIPPYDPNHFSVYRFLESIHNDCLPLITCDTYTHDFVQSFNISKEYINRITVDYSTIGDKVNELTENERQFLLKYFKEICLVNDKKLKIGL